MYDGGEVIDSGCDAKYGGFEAIVGGCDAIGGGCEATGGGCESIDGGCKAIVCGCVAIYGVNEVSDGEVLPILVGVGGHIISSVELSTSTCTNGE